MGCRWELLSDAHGCDLPLTSSIQWSRPGSLSWDIDLTLEASYFFLGGAFLLWNFLSSHCPLYFCSLSERKEMYIHTTWITSFIDSWNNTNLADHRKLSFSFLWFIYFFSFYFILFWYCWHYYRCPHPPTSAHLHPAPAPASLWPSPHCCLSPWLRHMCSLARPFTFFHPVPPPPPGKEVVIFNDGEQLLVANLDFFQLLTVSIHPVFEGLQCVRHCGGRWPWTRHHSVVCSALRSQARRQEGAERGQQSHLPCAQDCVCVFFLFSLHFCVVPHGPLLHTPKLCQSEFRNLLVNSEIEGKGAQEMKNL